MMAKTRVKSTKETTIPRLELQGAVLAANMHTYITKYLGPLPTTFWTDSTIVLNWIHTEASQYKVFVGNRVKLIQDNNSVHLVKDSQKCILTIHLSDPAQAVELTRAAQSSRISRSQ